MEAAPIRYVAELADDIIRLLVSAGLPLKTAWFVVERLAAADNLTTSMAGD